jgi:cystathionine beta-lyase
MNGGFDDVDVERLRRRRTVKWTLHGPDVLAAWVAEMDFDVAPVVRDAILDAVDREDFGYVVADLGDLTGACSDFLAASYGWSVSPARVFAVADVLAGITGALELHVPAGAPVVVPSPAYPPFYEIVELTGRRPVPVPLVRDRDRIALDIDRIETELARGAGAVLLCNPHNPTGRVFAVDDLRALATVVDRHGARVVADEVHAPLVLGSSHHVPYATVGDAAADHGVTITSASKAFNLAGLECAQVIASNHGDATRWRTRRVFEVPGPTPLGIAASTAAYRDGRAWLRDLVAYLTGNRDHLVASVAARLPEVRLDPPAATFLAWLDCSALGLDDPARFFLDAARVALSDGPPFGPGCEAFVRLNFGTSRRVLDRILDAMADAVAAR